MHSNGNHEATAAPHGEGWHAFRAHNASLADHAMACGLRLSRRLAHVLSERASSKAQHHIAVPRASHTRRQVSELYTFPQPRCTPRSEEQQANPRSE